MNTEKKPIDREAYYEDEISLYDLFRVLVKRKKLIAIVAAVVLIGCLIYVFAAQRVYRVQAILLPPAQGDVYLTNIDIAKDTEFKPEEIYKLYTQEIMSNDRWTSFTRQEKKFFPDPDSEVATENQLKLGKDKDFPGEHTLLTYDTSDQGNAATIFQAYLQFAQQNLVHTLTQQLSRYIQHNTKALEKEIQFERDAAKQKRMDKIVRLKSDLAIARKLGIVEDLYFSLGGKPTGNKSGVFNIFANNTRIPSYLRGTKAISAELTSLENRTSDDAYIPSLRQKQNELRKLKQVRFTPDAFHAYRLNGGIDKPLHPVKPQKILIMVLGGVLGLFLGIFAAFFAEFIAKAREQGV